MVGDNVISFGQSASGVRRRLAESRLTPLLKAMRGRTLETLPRLIQDLFEHLDDDLYEHADKASNDDMQMRYFEAMRELRKQREVLEKSFIDGCLASFDDFWSKSRPSSDGPIDSCDVEELSLLDDTELELDLAISSMIAKASNRFHRELFAMNMRFASMLGRGEIESRENPIGPQVFARQFADALNRWQGDTIVKLMVFKLFDRHFMAYIGGLYDDVNDVLIGADILPKLITQVRRNPVAPSVQRARAPQLPEQHYPELEGATDEAGDLDGKEVVSMLAHLLATRRTRISGAVRGVLGDVGASHLPEVSRVDLISALDQVQQRTADVEPQDLVQIHELQSALDVQLGAELGLGSSDHRERRLAKSDQDMLDIIGMMFDFILGDTNLPDPMKVLLGRLQIPMFKVAVLDRSLFSDRRHPARQLLNLLARAGAAWSDDGDRSPQSPFGQIEKAVSQILLEFHDDPKIFEQVLEEFSRYMDKERRSAEVAEQRVGEIRAGQEQMELARQRVQQVIQEQMDLWSMQQVVPVSVQRLLNEGWHDVLLLTYLREGEQSDNWTQATQMVELLLWSVQPKIEQAERQRLLKLIPDLLKRLREGLNNISFDQNRASLLFKGLQTCHIAALRGAVVEGEAASDPAQQLPRDAAETKALAEEEVVPHDDAYRLVAAELRIGQWLEWKQEGGGWLRGKLSWRSEITGNCIFVSRKGSKLAEMTLAELAQMIREDSAHILPDLEKPLMDRALHAMLATLQRTEPDADDSDPDLLEPSPEQ